MAYVFAPSLIGPKQDATLALHKCWGVADAQRGNGGAPPPPLMVMVGAMLRSPALDEVRLFNRAMERWSDNTGDDNSQAVVNSLRDQLESGIAANDTDALAAVALLPNVDQIAAHPYGAMWLTHLQETVVTNACQAAAAHRNFSAFATVLKRVLLHIASCDRSKLRYAPRCGKEVLGEYLATLPAPFNDVLHCIGTRFDKPSLDVEEFDRIVAQYPADTTQRQASLPMGDVQALLRAHRAVLSDPTARADSVVRALEQQISRGSFTLEAAVEALAELGRGDIGAMLFATAGDATRELWLTEVQRDARGLEMRMIATHHGGSTVGRSPMPGVMSAFDADGNATVRVSSPCSLDHCHVLLRSVADDALNKSAFGGVQSQRHPGSAAYADRMSFERRWAVQLCGLLDGWDWSNCVAAGGAVVRALVSGRDDDSTASKNTVAPGASSDSDVDLFFYGLGVQGVRERLQALERHVRSKVGAGHYVVLLTTKTMTIVVEGAPRLQVALGLWSSVSDVLSTCDVDCCGVGYDGSEVVMVGRAAAAYASRVNVASASRHMVRGSIHYEMRLWKYARRYGFAVLDPLYWDDDEAVEAARAVLTTQFADAKKSHARRAATTLSGLKWLMAVDAGYVKPKEVKSDLALSGQKTLAAVIEKVSENGYMESDNYGSHEQGYIVVKERHADDPAEEDDTEVDDRWAYLDASAALYNHAFANRVPIADVDVFDSTRYREKPWQLNTATTTQ